MTEPLKIADKTRNILVKISYALLVVLVVGFIIYFYGSFSLGMEDSRDARIVVLVGMCVTAGAIIPLTVLRLILSGPQVTDNAENIPNNSSSKV